MDKPVLIEHADATRCFWCGDDPEYMAYHDTEWGRPVTDDNRLYEKICLEGFQSGLSWLTILRKRGNFRAAFADFNIDKVARFNTRSVERLLGDAGIVRHRGKIESTINNARRARELRNEFGSLAAYFWAYASFDEFPGMVATTPDSVRMSKDLKKRGWSFVGPTTAYAFMQSVGLVNDHFPGCDFRDVCERERKKVAKTITPAVLDAP